MFRCWHAANKSRTLCQIDWLLMGKTKGFEEIPLIEGSLGHVKHESHTWGSQIHPSYMHFVQKGWWFTKAQFIADAGQLTLEWKNVFVGLCELVSYSKTLAFVGKRGIFSLTAGISFRRFRKPAYCTVSLEERWQHPSVEALSTRTPELRALSLAQNGPGEPSMERKKALATFSALKWIGEISRI